MTFIDTHCAKSKTCNDYFLSLGKLTGIPPISLRQILDRKHLKIYRLGERNTGDDGDDRKLPAGYTYAWGPSEAQIAINRIQLTDSGNVASTLLHELAHVAGAPGRDVDPNSLAAEKSVLFCFSSKMAKEFYDENAFGMITDTTGSRKGIA